MGEFKVGVKSIILYNRKVLLVQRADISGTSRSNEWEFPGGLMEFGEDLHAALRREIKEETGLDDINIEKLLYAITVKVSPERQVVGLMYLSHAKGDIVKISEEHIDFMWANKEQLINLLNTPMFNELKENNFLDSLEID